MGRDRRGRGSSPRATVARRALALALLALVLVPLVRTAAAARLSPADLAFNNGAEVTSLDPATVTGVPEGRVMRALYEGLYVKHPRTLALLPGVATGHELSSDGRTYTFHLRADARWSNGEPVTAQDFAASWQRLLAPETAAEYAYELWCIAGAREYSRLPADRMYTADVEAVWVQPVGERASSESKPLSRPASIAGPRARVRLGASGALARSASPDAPVVLRAREGAEIAAGDVFCELGTRALVAPLAGRVAAVNAIAPGAAGELARDPYEQGWLVELEVAGETTADEHALGGALDSLIDGERYPNEIFWPRAVGLRTPDARTLVVELEVPTPWFPELTAYHPLYPVNVKSLAAARERWPDTWQLEWMRPEHLVSNGPFRLVERRVNDRLRLAKSATYWDADSVALDSLDVLAVESYSTMLNLYLAGEVAWIDRVSPLVVHRLLGREDFRPVPYLATYFFRVNTTRPPFDDVRVRTALALAIDRREICAKVAKGGQTPSWSLVPPLARGAEDGYRGAELAHAADFATDVARARSLLAAAGFGAGGADLPALEIHFNTSEMHRDIAEVVAAGWREHLGLDARLLNQEWKVYLDAQKNLRYDVSRSSWIADYSDPSTFLGVFAAGGENNRTGWASAEYDELLSRARSELDAAARYRLLAEAEALLLSELPILPVYTYATQTVANPRLGGFHQNALDEHFPKFWYWKSDAELARDREELVAEGVELAPAPGPRAGKYARNPPAHALSGTAAPGLPASGEPATAEPERTD